MLIEANFFKWNLDLDQKSMIISKLSFRAVKISCRSSITFSSFEIWLIIQVSTTQSPFLESSCWLFLRNHDAKRLQSSISGVEIIFYMMMMLLINILLLLSASTCIFVSCHKFIEHFKMLLLLLFGWCYFILQLPNVLEHVGCCLTHLFYLLVLHL